MLVVRRVTQQAQQQAVFEVRMKVFVEEQGVPQEIEIDKYDQYAIHVLAVYDSLPVGTGRMRMIDDVAKLERICVLSNYRRLGIGQAIMLMLEEIALEQGLIETKLHAQTHAIPFYSQIGYQIDSSEFMEENILHVRMKKVLRSEEHRT